MFVAEIEAEQMNLVVARDPLALVVIDQAGIANFFGLSQASGTEPPTSQMACFLACAARNFWIGPLPSTSATATLSVSFMPMMAKNSGNATSLAPALTAMLIKRSASARFAATLGPEAI
jgi:hypothetical protein